MTGSSDVKKRSLLSKAGCEIFTLPLKNGRIDLKTLMRKLGEMDIDSVLMEGGPQLNSAALESGIVRKSTGLYFPKAVWGPAGKNACRRNWR